ncbi:sulfate adenylyltransferase subunit 2 [Pandoraea terrigena]|uniref:Sulfate adenylyltransferase subunit 2 n=2 Tax=Pandoraea terrigena TaxID=2508292 RepID=A0A5E4XST1_9BURK|nr:sulfate adenylyltransferase subunit 2 [Pandoraea terrigena]
MTTSVIFGLDANRVWDTETAFQHLQSLGEVSTKRTAERRLRDLGVLAGELKEDVLEDELGRPANNLVLAWALDKSRSKRKLPLFAQLHEMPNGVTSLQANDARGAVYWIPIVDAPLGTAILLAALQRIQQHVGKEVAVFPHGELVRWLREVTSTQWVTLTPNAYMPIVAPLQSAIAPRHFAATPHLRRLEAESIHIIREAVAEADNPAMLYSIGKDSSVMLHLARKAFHPAPPPFPLLHVDTRWKFQEMYLFRDRLAEVSRQDLLVHVNPEAIAKGINPFDHGSALHTNITKTEGLKQALDKYKFDVVFGGARRDEEKSRAKERIFSFRTQTHRWDPKHQRPELWNLYNTQKSRGESIRAFPLSNWTELDIWQYILQENIPIVPLYFAKVRPVVVRDGTLLLVDDNRFRLLPGEEITEKMVRFRTLGCYPLTGAIESNAKSVPEIILELINTRTSERQGRAIDSDSNASMEKKKQEGYF